MAIVSYMARYTITEQVPRVEVVENPDGTYTEVTTYEEETFTNDERIVDFSAASIAAYAESGAIAIAVNDDDTEQQVDWSSVSDPAVPAEDASSEAAEVAAATRQHFFTDTNGIHVTEAEKDDWDASPAGHNVLVNSLGILLRNALVNLVSITRSAIAFFDGEGNAASNIVASFGKDGATVGKLSDAHMVVSNSYLYLNDSNGSPVFFLSPSLEKVWRSFRINVGLFPDSEGVIRTSLEPGESALYELDGSFDLSQRPLSVWSQSRGNSFSGNGTKRVGVLSVTVTAGSSGATVELENAGTATYIISNTESNATLISGWSERRAYRIGVEGEMGLTQQVAIGDKTLTITGGIITGIS